MFPLSDVPCFTVPDVPLKKTGVPLISRVLFVFTSIGSVSPTTRTGVPSQYFKDIPWTGVFMSEAAGSVLNMFSDDAVYCRIKTEGYIMYYATRFVS